MSVWVTIPSARPAAEVNRWAEKWLDMGYRIMLQRDFTTDNQELSRYSGCAVRLRPWAGYAEAVNFLTSRVLAKDPNCDWCVATGDDTDPDPVERADEIAAECSHHFGVIHDVPDFECSTMGVMQPTGDPWRDVRGRIIERIAGSPWLGREWCRRAYGGNGPLYAGYTHCFADEELQLVAQSLGVFWQRPDLTHHHRNWARKEGATYEDMPAFLGEACSAEHWAKYSALFNERKAAGFPGHEPIA